MNALTKAAYNRIRSESFENYTIAVVCGIILGLMLGLGV